MDHCCRAWENIRELSEPCAPYAATSDWARAQSRVDHCPSMPALSATAVHHVMCGGTASRIMLEGH